MKKMVMLIILLMTFLSLGGCFWEVQGRGRGGERDDRGEGYDDQRGGVHEGESGGRPEHR